MLQRQIGKIVSCWNMKKYTSASVMECLADIFQKLDMDVWRHLVSEFIRATKLKEEQVWAIIVQYLLEKSNAGQAIDRHSLRLLNVALNSVPKENMDFITARLENI